MSQNRYFHYDEATDSFLEIKEQRPVWFVRVVTIAAGLFVLASVLL